MRSFLPLCLLLCLFTLTAAAQTPLPPELKNQPIQNRLSPSDKDGSTNDPVIKQPGQTLPDVRTTPKVADGKFTALMLGVQASTVLDIESSFHTLRNCPAGFTCTEGNPLFRPFVRAGRTSAYSFAISINSLVWWKSYEMKKRGKRFWWLGPTILIATHTTAAIRNYRVSARSGVSANQ